MKTGKTETKNTPQPWVKEYIKGDYLSVDKVIISSGGDWIATVSAEHIGTIWSALNGLRSHEELFEAVKTMLAYYNDEINLNGTAIKLMLEKAIAKVKGRQ